MDLTAALAFRANLNGKPDPVKEILDTADCLRSTINTHVTGDEPGAVRVTFNAKAIKTFLSELRLRATLCGMSAEALKGAQKPVRDFAAELKQMKAEEDMDVAGTAGKVEVETKISIICAGLSELQDHQLDIEARLERLERVHVDAGIGVHAAERGASGGAATSTRTEKKRRVGTPTVTAEN